MPHHIYDEKPSLKEQSLCYRLIVQNLAPAHPGAAGAYNALIGDFDGSLGSGGKGWVLLDSSDPQKGFKSWDWWGPFRATDKNWPTGNNTWQGASLCAIQATDNDLLDSRPSTR